MARPLLFLPAARLELIEARDWYEKEALGLGARFLSELDHQAARIASNPSQFPQVVEDTRRARFRRFPYSVYFRPLDDAIYVIACFHASRDPSIWQGRT